MVEDLEWQLVRRIMVMHLVKRNQEEINRVIIFMVSIVILQGSSGDD